MHRTRRWIPATTIAAAMLATVLTAPADAFGPTSDSFTYQGRLTQNGTAVTSSTNLSFRLFDAETDGTQIGSTLDAFGFADFDSDGRFTIDLAFGQPVFDGSERWLEVWVNGAPLTPRQLIMPAPYAVRALTIGQIANESLGGSYSNQIDLKNPANMIFGTFNGNGAGLSNLNASALTAGTVSGTLLSGSYTNALTLNNISNVFVGDGSGLADLDASNITTGSLNVARMPLGGNWSLTSSLAVDGDRLFVSHLGSPFVGINITSPVTGSDAFSVRSPNVAGYGGMYLDTAGSSALPFYGYATSGSPRAWHYFDALDNAWRLNVANIDRLSVTATGNVGIGVDAPTHKLELSNHSTPSGGIGFGSDVDLFRSATDILSLGSGDSINVSGGQYRVGNSVVISATRNILAVDGNSTVPGYGFLSGTSAGVGMYKPASDNLAFATSGQERIRINQSGNVGIGVFSPTFQLQLSQNSAAKPTSSAWTIFSDARLKKNVHTIEGALDDLLALRGVTYQWKSPEAQGDMKGTYTGLIAQEVEKVFPEWISEGDDGFKRLTVIGFEGIVVEALRELRKEKDQAIDALTAENDELRERLALLEAIVAELAPATTGGAR